MPDTMGDMEWTRGDSYAIPLTIKSGGVAIDITGYAFALTVNEEQNPTDNSKQKFTVDAVIDPDQVTNIGMLTFKPTEENTDFIEGTYYYDVQMTLPASAGKRTIKKMKWKQVQDITKT